jgi:hypothetical protein
MKAHLPVYQVFLRNTEFGGLPVDATNGDVVNCLVEGGISPCLRSDAAQISRRVLIFGANICTQLDKNLAVSNSVQLWNGDQSSGNCSVRGSGGVPGDKKRPFASHG